MSCLTYEQDHACLPIYQSLFLMLDYFC